MAAVARVERSKDEARANYDRRSRSYERLEGRFERRARVTGEELLAVAPGETVLEIGSGPGVSLVALARATGPEGRVVGVDLAPAMHEVARDRLGGVSGTGRVSLAVADGACLPLRPATVDAVFMSFTLELFDTPELPVVLDEAHRVLREAGRLVVVSLLTTEPPALMERLYLAAHRLMPSLADCRPVPVADLLTSSGFAITAERRCDIFGLPVMVVAARRA